MNDAQQSDHIGFLIDFRMVVTLIFNNPRVRGNRDFGLFHYKFSQCHFGTECNRLMSCGYNHPNCDVGISSHIRQFFHEKNIEFGSMTEFMSSWEHFDMACKKIRDAF